MATDTENKVEPTAWDLLRGDLYELKKNRTRLAAETATARTLLSRLSSELAKVDYTVTWLESWVKKHEPKDVSE